MLGVNYKCNFLVSPFSWNNVTVPFRLDSSRTGNNHTLPFTPFQLGDSQYSQTDTGVFFETDFSYSVDVIQLGTVGVWFNGKWARFQNKGLARRSCLPIRWNYRIS